MLNLFFRVVCAVIRGVVSLRYKVEVKGFEKLTPEKLNRKGGVLFLPNHPAHMDPLIIFSLLLPKFRMRPLVVEHMYRTPLLGLVNGLVRSICIPSFESAVNEYKKRKGERAVREIADGLKAGDNFVMYPAGRLKQTGAEIIGGASAAHELVRECSDANIVLMRTTGLWGSSFSRALIGKSPNLPKTFLAGFVILLKNGIFFAPRRKVTIEIEPNPQDLPRDADRVTFNRYLENWYNRYEDREGHVSDVEPLTLVSYSRFRRELPVVTAKAKQSADLSSLKVDPKIEARVFAEIRRILDRPELPLNPKMRLAMDLGMDSLNVAELVAFLVKGFEARNIRPEEMDTVGSVLEAAQEGKSGGERELPKVTFHFPHEHTRLAPDLPTGSTIPEAFFNVCEKMGKAYACGDDNSGPLTYHKMRLAVLVLAQHFEKWEEKHVAVMLPASCGAYIAILALQAAGKVPVMLNWTLGSRYLEEMMKISGAKRVVTSWRFVDRLANVQFGSLMDQFVFLEEVRSKLPLSSKLKALFLRASLIKRFSRLQENDPCVILFTSGTEAAPKGVPLSHKNIISNQRAGMQCLSFAASDVLHGILPPFHSFGFSVAGLFPILCGFRIAFYPDPTDGFALAEHIQRWKVTICCAAPSFLKGLFRAAKPEQLQTIRLVISGAEKASEELVEKVKEIGAQFIEGYGITECAPALTMNRVNREGSGSVGQLLPDIELITIHPETLKLQPNTQEGEICVRGPNVFSGYLGNPRTPFIEIDGKQWYRTGDLGYLDDTGSLILSGRLKRFVKIGGEMISLGAVESTLAKALVKMNKVGGDVTAAAVVALEAGRERAELILFTIAEITRDEVNEILHEAGFSNIVKISSVKHVTDIPLMGAGKTDYRALQAMLK